MNNKVLVKLYVPEISFDFDVFLPVNEIIWKIKKMLVKSVSDLTGGAINSDLNYVLFNKMTNEVYDNNSLVLNTNIRNASELILMIAKEN